MNKKTNEFEVKNNQAEAVEPHIAVLDTLEAEAAQSEAEAVAEAEAMPQAEMDKKAGEWAQIPFMLGGILTQFFPKLEQVYRWEACHDWGKNAAMVADKYGWGDAPIGCELMLAVSTAGFALPTYAIVKAELDNQEKQRRMQSGKAQVVADALQDKPAEPQPAQPVDSHTIPPNIFAGSK